MPVAGFRIPHSAFRLGLRLAAIALVVGVLAPLAALAWNDWAHERIVLESVTRLPEPVRGLFSEGKRLAQLEAASVAADKRREQFRDQHSPQEAEERIKHFFDIDAISKKPYPFDDVPHDRKAAEAKFGVKAFEEHGTAPWAVIDAMDSLTEALKSGAAEETVLAAAGDLAHFAADIHMPLHVTNSYFAKDSPNRGIHLMLEVGLVKRYGDFYAAEVAKGRTEVSYLPNPLDSVFQWIGRAYQRAEVVLKADGEARAESQYPADEAESKKDVDNLGAERAAHYYEALKKKLEEGVLPGDGAPPDAAAMRDAAAHVADLYYTAWVNAGKPEALGSAAAPAPPEEKPSGYWVLIPLVLLTVLLLIPRRRPIQK